MTPRLPIATRCATLACILTAAAASAAELRVLPPAVELTGPHAAQQLLAVEHAAGRATADRTAAATFVSSDPAIVAVGEDGVVRAKGDGEATVTVTAGGQSATVRVRVTKAKAPGAWDFRNHVVPVLTRVGCNGGACHGALAGKGGLKLSLRGYDPDADHFALTRQALGRRVDRTDPEASLLLAKPTRKLPHGGGKLFADDTEEYRRLREWVAAGAHGPRAGTPTVTRIEPFPAAATLKAGDKLRVVVRAVYSDGHAEDVTAWVRFASSEEQVAAVDDAGRVTVQGTGEAAVNVMYANHVAATTIAVPRDTDNDPKIFAASPRHNFIDDHVLRKLEGLRLPPSPQCDDREFVRRAFLDCAGCLPTPQEADAFVADASPDKRSKVIDALMTRPEFVDYWAYKWSDLLLVSSRKLATAQMWSYYRFVRAAVAENRPWDRFARDVLTAQGSSSANGAVNYFVLHKDTAELTEATSIAFLGLSVTCAKCHNHPLEKWTQDQYWSLANLFGRVGVKNGDRPGEVVVQSLADGDVPHLRRGVAMPPTPLDGKPWAEGMADRRAYFADWLTARENPFFAKALVNRVWKNFLGRGLVEAEDDLRQTNPPTNPELLDALANDFVAHRYDVRHLIRQVMNSAAYQRSSASMAGNEADDRFYSRYLVRRLPAEVLLDAYAQVTGVPTKFDTIRTGGTVPTGPTELYPAGTRAQQLPDVQLVSRFLDAFGRPAREQTCSCERNPDASVGQALHVANGPTLNDKLTAKEAIVSRWLDAKASDADVVRDLFARALSRAPTPSEAAKLAALLAESKGDRRAALEDLTWGVLTGREFLFNR